MHDRLVDDGAREADHWLALARAAAAPGERILALGRAVGAGADAETLTAALDAVPGLDAAARKELTSQSDRAIERMKRSGRPPEAILEQIARRLDAGAEPSYLLRATARMLDAWGHSRAALQYMTAAMAVAPPDRTWYRDTLALIYINQGRFAEAIAQIDLLADADPAQAAWLRTYATALRQPFDYWWGELLKRTPPDDVVPSPRTVEEARGEISRLAGRIEHLLEPLREAVGDAMPLPDVAHLEPKGGAPPLHELFGGANLLVFLRKEWARLCWTLVALGQKSLALPEEVARPPETFEYLDTIFSVRFNLLSDRADGGTIEPQDELDRREMTRQWGGTALCEIQPHLAGAWREEVSAILAAIRWAKGDLDTIFDDQ